MTTDRPFTRENKRQSSVAKPSIFFTEITIQTYQSTDGSHESPSSKATTKRSTQENLLPEKVEFPSDRPNKGANITFIVSTALAVLLVVLLIVLGFILWRRRLHKNKGDRQESHEVENIEPEPSVPRQTSCDETYFLPNASSSSLPDQITKEEPHLYAVIDKTGNKDGHSSSNMTMPCQTMPHSDEHVVTLCPTLEPLLKAKEHIYENTTQEDSKRKPPLYPTPYCARYKRLQEHSDDTEKEYVYAGVDKTRAKKTNDETCGLVYAELELKPTQDEDETEVTAKGCVTIYSSVQEQQ
ncbi:uncharacterized protein [Porites lutea]|uniref:uncharacterized protein n=1 Tax=Porites lutea TaxID=51062 RepID=UPI003CC56C65